jgi:probable O-glycosylation ligase (exosortase A-associated)
MRDYALLVILVSLVFLALYRPWLGVLGLAVLGFMHPQGYGGGFMQRFPAYAVLFAAAAGGYLINQFRQRRWPVLRWDWRLVGVAILFGWFLVSTHFALAPAAAREKLAEVLKILPPLVLVWLLIDTREKLVWLLVAIGLSITLVTVKGGYWAIMTGFTDRVYGPPGSQYADNNEFAVAVAMAIPLLFVWLRETRDSTLRWAVLALIALSYLSTLTSWSRGGLLSLVAMSLVLVWQSHRKWLAMPIVALGLLAVPMVFSDKWLARMQSIFAFEADASAQSRLSIWRVGWDATIERPLTGNGFDAWPILSESNGRFLDWHSAYVEIMAEHGFVGLAIWGALLVGTTLSLSWVARAGGRRNQPWVTSYAGMLQASLVAYLVGALTLGIAYWELPLWLITSAAIVAWLDRAHDLPAGARSVDSPRPSGESAAHADKMSVGLTDGQARRY